MAVAATPPGIDARPNAGAGAGVLLGARAAGRATVLAWFGASTGCVHLLARLGIPAARRRRSRSAERLAERLDRLGGTYLKLGQILSTRADLLADAQRAPLARLCDRATPLPRAAAEVASLGEGGGLAEIDPSPFAAGSFTHVHLARRRDTGERVVVKVLRADARARFGADAALIGGVARMGTHIPLLRSVPVMASVRMLTNAIAGHLDLAAEAACHARLAAAFADSDDVIVPRPHLDLSGPRVLVMDHVGAALRIDDPRLDPELQRQAALSALRALYAMLFDSGVVHCDLHPGNMLVTAQGKLVLIDFGYTSRLTREQQAAFAELFRAMAFSDAAAVADVVVDTAVRVPDRLDHGALVSDLRGLVAGVSGATAEQFNVVRFVASLFAIQRRHRILASPDFTMGIVALATLEGVLKQLVPALDFQREALPFVLARLAARPVEGSMA